MLAKSGEQTGRGGSNRIDYFLTLDTTKEMAMLERNDMGKMVRRYFIEAEKRYRELKIIRARSKAERRLFTDILKEVLPENPNKNWQYKQFTDLVYKHVTGYNANQLREKFGIRKKESLRDCFTQEELQAVQSMECLVSGLVDCGWEYDQVKVFIQQNNAQRHLVA